MLNLSDRLAVSNIQHKKPCLYRYRKKQHPSCQAAIFSNEYTLLERICRVTLRTFLQNCFLKSG